MEDFQIQLFNTVKVLKAKYYSLKIILAWGFETNTSM